MYTEKQSTKNMEHCPHFKSCSQNFCPLDLKLQERSGSTQDKCRWMREARKTKIKGKEFISGGKVMPNATLKYVIKRNMSTLNEASQKQWKRIHEENN
ncbi:MAG: hypothetical protein V1652_02650 [bacterium]